MKPTQTPRVIIRHCDSYDPERIRRIVREGLEELDLRPRGKTLVKPNLVASGPLFEHAHTRVEFAEGVLRALQDRDDGQVTELAIGERCGITVPTRSAFEGANYNPMIKRVGVKQYFFEEEQQKEIRYTHEGRLRDYVFTPRPIAECDFFVNMPKFKAHPWTTVTFGNKAYIGIQDDRHRLIDHDHRLDEKIADLQYIIQPEFLVIDAIIAGEGRMLTPIPRNLNLIIMGNNQCAFDAVCCAIIGVNAKDVAHIRLASDRGFGTLDLEKIAISGDVTLDEARKRAHGFEVGLVRVEKYFEGSHITAYAGPPPDAEKVDYCWGGCPGSIEEAIEILRLYDKECDDKMPRTHVVFGAYQGKIDAKPGEKVVFIGDCATWKGEINKQPVQITSKYKDRSTKDPYTAVHMDIYAKMAKTVKMMKASKDATYIQLEGCPVSVSEVVLFLVEHGHLNSPFLDKSQALTFTKNYLMWRSSSGVKRLMGQTYQKAGPCQRGQAAPDVKAPAPAE